MTSSILIIEDDKSVREVLNEYLVQTGFHVLSAADGLEGLDMIKHRNYDLLVLGIDLPYVSGIGLIKVTREINPGIPIICITNSDYFQEKVAEAEKADLVIRKPLKLEEFSKKIGQLISRK